MRNVTIPRGRWEHLDDEYVTERAGDTHRRNRRRDPRLRALADFARTNGCGELHLDSGVHRDRAHRFDFTQGLAVKSFHFSMALDHTNSETQ